MSLTPTNHAHGVLHVIVDATGNNSLSNGPAKKQAEKPQAAAIASVIFEALISLIKLNLNALIGQRSEKREI